MSGGCWWAVFCGGVVVSQAEYCICELMCNVASPNFSMMELVGTYFHQHYPSQWSWSEAASGEAAVRNGARGGESEPNWPHLARVCFQSSLE